MTEHYLKLRGAAVVATDQLLDTRDLVADLLEVKGMGAVYGPAGTGKTFAVDQALGEHPQRLWMRTVFRSRPTTRYVRHELYVQIGLGVAPPASPVETDVLLKRALGERVRLVVIDESQWLNRECFEYLATSMTIPAPPSPSCWSAERAATRCSVASPCWTRACMPICALRS
jgi:hypothetical protein